MAGNPWNEMPVRESFDRLIEIPSFFPRQDPHPYQAAGAVYPAGSSPFMARKEAVHRLMLAQFALAKEEPGVCLKIYDAYRPPEVQAQMVVLTLADFARNDNLDPDKLSKKDEKRLMEKVLVYWSKPSLDPKTPPLHSTGGSIDVGVIGRDGKEWDMGVPFDHFGKESATMYFASRDRHIHERRMKLCRAMVGAGFVNYEEEWWHYSFGDQLYALQQRKMGHPRAKAFYGRADLLPPSRLPKAMHRPLDPAA